MNLFFSVTAMGAEDICHLNPFNNSCVAFLIGHQISWDEADTMCRENYKGHLFEVKTTEILEWFRNLTVYESEY